MPVRLPPESRPESRTEGGSVSDRRTLLACAGAMLVTGAVARDANAQCPKVEWTANVKDYGALGDNVNDDTQAILDALAAADYVFFPPGVYKVTQPLPIRSGLTIVGSGASSADSADPCQGTQIRMEGGTGSAVLESQSATASLSQVRLENLTVVFVSSQSGSAAVDFPHLRSSSLVNVTISNDNGDGLRVLQTNSGVTTLWLNGFINCYFRSNQAYAMVYEGTDSEFVGCYFTGGGPKQGLGALDQRKGGNRYIGCQFSRGAAGASGLEIRIASNLAGQYSSDGTMHTSITGCYFDECLGWALKFNNAAGVRSGDAIFSSTIQGCTFRGNPGGDIQLVSGGSLTIVGNTCFYGIAGKTSIQSTGSGSNIICTNNIVKGLISIPHLGGTIVSSNVFI